MTRKIENTKINLEVAGFLQALALEHPTIALDYLEHIRRHLQNPEAEPCIAVFSIDKELLEHPVYGEVIVHDYRFCVQTLSTPSDCKPFAVDLSKLEPPNREGPNVSSQPPT